MWEMDAQSIHRYVRHVRIMDYARYMNHMDNAQYISFIINSPNISINDIIRTLSNVRMIRVAASINISGVHILKYEIQQWKWFKRQHYYIYIVSPIAIPKSTFIHDVYDLCFMFEIWEHGKYPRLLHYKNDILGY